MGLHGLKNMGIVPPKSMMPPPISVSAKRGGAVLQITDLMPADKSPDAGDAIMNLLKQPYKPVPYNNKPFGSKLWRRWLNKRLKAEIEQAKSNYKILD